MYNIGGGGVMKRIGVIIPAVTDDHKRTMLESIAKTASAFGVEIVVLTTLTDGLPHQIQSRIMDGEENIFSMLNCFQLDGILFASQYFTKPDLVNMLIERIRSTSLPCIDLGGSQHGFETVCIPEGTAVYHLAEHLIKIHDCKKLLFLAGFEGNPDSEQRLYGVKQAAEKYNCTLEIVYGDFWTEKAEKLGNELLHSQRPMPDAILCANDMMAVTLCDILMGGGISIPDDVIVTGFDGQIYALVHMPSITTVSGSIAEIARIGTELLIERINQARPTQHESKLDIMYGASCGCTGKTENYHSASEQINDYLRREQIEEQRLELQVNADLITKFIGVKTLSELTALMDESTHILYNCRSFDLCLFSDWEGDLKNPYEYRTSKYTNKSISVFSKQESKLLTDRGIFRTAQILPYQPEWKHPRILFVLPLHCEEQVFGYCVLEYRRAKDYRVTIPLVNFLSAIANGLRILRHWNYSQYLEKKVNESKKYDKMTDLMSKNGLLEYLDIHNSNVGVLLLKIDCLTAFRQVKQGESFYDHKLQAELATASCLRLIAGSRYAAARLDRDTFAVAFQLTDESEISETAQEIMIQLEILLRKMQEGMGAVYLPELCYSSGFVKMDPAQCLSDLYNSIKPNTDLGFSGLTELRLLQKELHRSPELDWSLSMIAQRLHISRSYAQKLYKNIFGISYMDDLIHARIRKAKNLLKESNLTIREIASGCGYQSTTHFVRQFKNKTGVTPSEYRNGHNNPENES